MSSVKELIKLSYALQRIVKARPVGSKVSHSAVASRKLADTHKIVIIKLVYKVLCKVNSLELKVIFGRGRTKLNRVHRA